jgi:hypothetical protein
MRKGALLVDDGRRRTSRSQEYRQRSCGRDDNMSGRTKSATRVRHIGRGVKVCNLKCGAENQQESATKNKA